MRIADPLRQQARVLGALMLREMITRYGRSPAGYLWALIEPVAFIGLLSLAFSQIAHSPPLGRSFALFYATGYVAFHWFHDISSVTARSVQVNRPLLAFPPIKPLDTIIARFLLQVLTGVAVAFIIFGGILLIFDDQVRPDPVWLAQGFALATLFGLGVGMANAWLFSISRTWELIWGVLSRPLFLISCVFFSFWSVPGFVREVLWFNPIIHMVGAIRAGFYPVYDTSHLSQGYVIALSLVLLVFGLLSIRLAPGRLVSA